MAFITSSLADSSFRDPAGFMFERDGILYRQINRAGADDYERLMSSGLYEHLVDRGWLVSHEKVDIDPPEPGSAHGVIAPDRVAFVSFPYEWSFSQYRDAALLTLDVQLAALEHDMILKDASAYNVQFHQGRPVLIDTLSFAPYEEGQVWEGYRQFCQHFLAPLLLMARRDVRASQLMKVYIDGVPLDLASRLLDRRSWLRPGILMHLHLHARAQSRYAASDEGSRRSGGSPRKLSRTGMLGIVSGLRSLIAGLDWTPAGTEWADYYQATNYSDEAFSAKRRQIADWIESIGPERVWDLGANTGVFSRIAAERGIDTVAFDIDPAAVELNYRETRELDERNLLPLVMDLTNPSPALGWAGAERDSMAGRGPVDCAMALALVHHLAISNNVPLERIADYFARLCDNLIIEFVPKADSQVRRLLSSRADIFDNYHESGFEAAFSRCFRVEASESVAGSERTLYWLRRRAD
ncbi:MAG: SAM-dependent methyltransferase [Gammaproteobacteria bacterium]|jgi:ribosomal protein L11 methylase PrmA|nr:SAM-dependent methyltransferase [Gammaproteobacteria bacterium]